MKFLLNWLKVERPAGVSLHPTRTVELASPPDAAFARCRTIATDVLGGNITSEDPPHSIDVTFGLVNSERLSISIDPHPPGCTITIASRRLLSTQPAAGVSPYIARFARELEDIEKK